MAEARAINRYVMISPQKLRLVCDQVRGMSAEQALTVLKFMPQKGAEIVNSTIHGPAIIGEGTRIVNSYIGPFTSIRNDVEILESEIEHSIVLEGSSVRDLSNRVIDSLIGRNVRIYRIPVKPSAYRFMLGDNSEVGIRW